MARQEAPRRCCMAPAVSEGTSAAKRTGPIRDRDVVLRGALPGSSRSRPRGPWRSYARMARLRHRVAPGDGVYRDPLDVLQVTAPPPVAVDAGAVFSGPILDHALAVAAGETLLGEHPPDDLADAMGRFPVKRPPANVPVHPQKSCGRVGESPVFVGRVVLEHRPVIRATYGINNTKLVLVTK